MSVTSSTFEVQGCHHESANGKISMKNCDYGRPSIGSKMMALQQSGKAVAGLHVAGNARIVSRKAVPENTYTRQKVGFVIHEQRRDVIFST